MSYQGKKTPEASMRVNQKVFQWLIFVKEIGQFSNNSAFPRIWVMDNLTSNK